MMRNSLYIRKIGAMSLFSFPNKNDRPCEGAGAECDMSRILHRAFLTALMLTCSVRRAEAAVLQAIAGRACKGQLLQVLVIDTVKLCLEPTANVPKEVRHTHSILPRDLRRVLLLSHTHRLCFVLHVLVGLPSSICSQLLQLMSIQ